MADEVDPKGLMADAFAIEALTEEEARTILVDWSLSLKEGVDERAAAAVVLARHAGAQPDHPMRGLLKAAVASRAAPKRRGGWRGRR